MIKINTFIIIILFSLYNVNAQETKMQTTVYYLIRHAEKIRENTKDPNPDLSERGILRAQNWEKVLQHISFDAIYTTDFKRTIKTIEPLSKSQKVEFQKYHATKINVDEFMLQNIGKNVLIVGHSNTIPKFVNSLIKNNKYAEIGDDEFSHLYIVTIQENQITDLLLYIDF